MIGHNSPEIHAPVDPALLYAVYQLKHLPNNGDRQSVVVAKQLIDHLVKLLPRLPIDEQTIKSLAGFNPSELNLLLESLKFHGHQYRVEWKPKYGCAIIQETEEDRIIITLLALDLWCFDGVQDTQNISRGAFSAKSKGYTLISCGSLPAQKIVTFFSKLNELLTRSPKAAKESDGKRKDEKTPAFIEA
jgi:hypothetical protein